MEIISIFWLNFSVISNHRFSHSSSTFLLLSLYWFKRYNPVASGLFSGQLLGGRPGLLAGLSLPHTLCSWHWGSKKQKWTSWLPPKTVFLTVSQCVIQNLLFEFLAGQPLSLNQVKSPEFLEAAKPGTACGTLGYRSFINYPATLLSFGFLICKMEVINLLYQESMRMK